MSARRKVRVFLPQVVQVRSLPMVVQLLGLPLVTRVRMNRDRQARLSKLG